MTIENAKNRKQVSFKYGVHERSLPESMRTTHKRVVHQKILSESAYPRDLYTANSCSVSWSILVASFDQNYLNFTFFTNDNYTELN